VPTGAVVTRPAVVVFVTGTGTEVGKTWWGAAVARELRAAGVTVSARKPAQSGPPEARSDAAILADATGEAPDAVCRPARSYPLAWAPPMAAAELGRPAFVLADLVAELAWAAAPIVVGLVEGAGGPRSPLASDGDNVGFARLLGPDHILLVADAGLGTINAVCLACDALCDAGAPVVVALNRFDGANALHRRNREHLEALGLDVVVDVATIAHRLAAGPTP
jgi:dethiobiotin synthase